MATSRYVRNAAATLTHTFYVAETPTDPTGTPTYAIVDANGTSVASGNATIVGGNTGQLTAPLASQALVRSLTVTWVATVGGSSVTEVDQVEIVGGFLFGLAEGRAADSSLSDSVKYPTSDLIAARLRVEEECEQICDQAWCVRYRRVVLDGTGLTDLPIPEGGDVLRGGILLRGLRTVRRASTAPTVSGTFTDLTTTELSALAMTGDGKLRRTDGNVWPEGLDNVVLEYEYGNDAAPSDLKDASMMRFRQRLNFTKSGIPDRAQSYTVDGGGTYRLSMPEAFKTGVPEVDAAYWRYSRRSSGSGPNGEGVAAAAMTLTYEPQRYSLYHHR